MHLVLIRHTAALADWDGLLAEHGVLQTVERRPTLFLEEVVVQLLDQPPKDSFVSQKELVSGQMQAVQYAEAAEAAFPPNDLVSFVDAIAGGFDYSVLEIRGGAADAVSASLTAQLEQLEGHLRVQGIISSYNTAELLSQYVEGTRQWLYKDFRSWVQGVAPGHYAPASNESRAYLLLAGPGMGKSVFSAVIDAKLSTTNKNNVGVLVVRHFFKAGQPRAEGRAMLLSLAYQMAQQLGASMAALLAPVAAELGTCMDLDLDTVFRR
jgi:hypothetical protein